MDSRKVLRGLAIGLVAWMSGWGCGDDSGVAAEADAGARRADASLPPRYTVSGSVTGFDGDVLILDNGGNFLSVTEDGTFTFHRQLDDGDTYAVTVARNPRCPGRVCTVSNATGTIDGADVTDVEVTCAEPRIRLASLSWGDSKLRITDDLLEYEDKATASPRIVGGASTTLGNSTLDSVVIDPRRDLVYAISDGTIKVFSPASTISGDVEPVRTIVVKDVSLQGIALDVQRDRLYATGPDLFVFDHASTLDGAVLPTTIANVATCNALAYDRMRDRLFVSADYGEKLYTFDQASQLESSQVASWTEETGFNGPSALAVDECTGRLYVASNQASPDGYTVFAFDDPTVLDGEVNLETASDAQIELSACISADVDSSGRLYCWPDSPTAVWMFDSARSWMGPQSPAPDRTVQGVVSSGYGLSVADY